MKIKNIEIEDSGFRCSKKKLEKILSQVPVEFVGNNLKLKAFMGLGKKIYIRQTGGSLARLNVAGNTSPIEIILKQNYNKYFIFYYKNQCYQIESCTLN